MVRNKLYVILCCSKMTSLMVKLGSTRISAIAFQHLLKIFPFLVHIILLYIAIRVQPEEDSRL
jgi:hypothetical protein